MSAFKDTVGASSDRCKASSPVIVGILVNPERSALICMQLLREIELSMTEQILLMLFGAVPLRNLNTGFDVGSETFTTVSADFSSSLYDRKFQNFNVNLYFKNLRRVSDL